MEVIIFALKILAASMMITPFVTATGLVWIDHYFKKKVEEKVAWLEATKEVMCKQKKTSG